MSFMDNLKKNLKTGLSYSSEKIQEYSHIGKLKLDLMSKNRSIDLCNKEIGQKVYELMQANRSGEIAADVDVLDRIARIRKARLDIVDLERQLEEAGAKKA